MITTKDTKITKITKTGFLDRIFPILTRPKSSKSR
jgi:hypothetical protein